MIKFQNLTYQHLYYKWNIKHFIKYQQKIFQKYDKLGSFASKIKIFFNAGKFKPKNLICM